MKKRSIGSLLFIGLVLVIMYLPYRGGGGLLVQRQYGPHPH